MARQIGIMPIKGTIDELTFYEHPDDGALVRKKSRVTGEQVKTKPTYLATMQNAAEFKTSIHTGQILRGALARLLFPIADGKLSSRMNRELLKMVQQDKENRLGERMAYKGNLSMLEGFQFNRHLSLQDVFAPGIEITTDPLKGEIFIEVPGFKPTKDITAPKYVEHLQLICGGAVIDFENGHYVNEFWATERIPNTKEPVEELRFSYRNSIPAGYTMFLALGVLLYARLDNVPKEATSKRKRRRLNRLSEENGMVAFGGALALVKVIVGEPRSASGNETRNGEWEVDGLGIA
ncbi:hypothetical protein [Paraflavitalea speifideaquila]|uniref:hypothetical protein n=1 Tax=Paraflavitalea speifideaquila TaxID=3076558 RepID=UPI0028ECADF9|nr:hypothetical protein [Paraflavitalea speifideiaquila]